MSIYFESRREAYSVFGKINWLPKPIFGDFDPTHDGRKHETFQKLRIFGNSTVQIIGVKPNGSPQTGYIFILLESAEGNKIAQVKPSDFKGGNSLLKRVGLA